MSASELPDTETPVVINSSIAYEFVKKAFPLDPIKGNIGENYLRKMTNAYIKVFSAISNHKPLSEDDLKGI